MSHLSPRVSVGSPFAAARRFGVAMALFFLSAASAHTAPAPAIQWSPSVITHTIGGGAASDLLQAAFTSGENLADVTVFVTPNLRPFIQLESSEFAQVQVDIIHELRGRFVVPAGAVAGVYDGTIHLRVGRKTVSRPLRVVLTVDYGENRVPETTAVVSNTAAAQIQDVAADGSSIVFAGTATEIREVVAGDVMVLGVTPQTPDGLLRKVEQVIDAGNRLTVVTSPATLEDTFEHAEVSVARALTASDVEGFVAQQRGVQLVPVEQTMSRMSDAGVAAMAGPEFYLTLKDVVLYDDDRNLNTTYDQIRANGEISLSPSLDFAMSIRDWRLTHLLIAAGFNQRAEISVASGVSLDFVQAETRIGRISFNSMTIWVGWVPIVIKPQLDINVGLDGSVSAEISAGVWEEVTARAGVSYSSSTGWTPIQQSQMEFGYDPPAVNGSFNLKVHGGPKLTLLLYGAAGPWVAAHAYLELEAELFADPWWVLYAGLDGFAGIHMEVLGRTLADYQVPLTLGFRVPLVCAPDLTAPAVTVPADIAAVASTAEGAVVTFTAMANDSRDGSVETTCTPASGSTFAVGTTTVTCTATDAAGNTGAGSFAVAVVYMPSTRDLVGWGHSEYGQTTGPAGLTGVTAVAAGGYHNLALNGDGTVVAWGINSEGQTDVPAGLTAGTVTAIAAGDHSSLALKTDGTVVGWGTNVYGQTTVPTDLTGVTAIAAGSYHSLALKGDGTVVAWGASGIQSLGQTDVPAALTGVKAIAAGRYHSVALKSDGTVVAWGDNEYGQTDVPASLTGVTVTAIAAGAYHSLALTSDGTVVAWGVTSGTHGWGQAVVPSGLTDVTAIAAGAYHSLVLKSDGTVATWGANWFGQTTLPAGLTRVVAISAGAAHSLVIVGVQ